MKMENIVPEELFTRSFDVKHPGHMPGDYFTAGYQTGKTHNKHDG